MAYRVITFIQTSNSTVCIFSIQLDTMLKVFFVDFAVREYAYIKLYQCTKNLKNISMQGKWTKNCEAYTLNGHAHHVAT